MAQEMDLRELFQVIWKRKYILVLLPLIAVLTSGFLSYKVIIPVYEASATLIVHKSGEAVMRDDYTSLLAAKELVKTYSEIAKSRTVAEKVSINLGGELSAKEIQEMVRVSLLGDTIMLRISAKDTSPKRASRLVNTVAYVFSQEAKDILLVDSVKVLDPSIEPTVPVKPVTALNMAIAAVIGSIVVVGMIFFLNFLDDSIKTAEDVDKYLGIPVLGAIPLIEEK